MRLSGVSVFQRPAPERPTSLVTCLSSQPTAELLMEIGIRPVTQSDAAVIAAIYNTYVLGTCVTFETKPVDASQMAQRIAETMSVPLPWLVAELSGVAMHSVIGGIALPNAASIALHESLGFRKIAHFEQVDNRQDCWVDVNYWQRLSV